MNSRIVLLVMALPLVGVSKPVDADVLCSKPSGLVFVRANHCKGKEQRLNPAALGVKPQIRFFDEERSGVVVDPGEELIVAVQCEDDEVVVSGGYITDPNDALRVTLNTFFFDGLHSGWRVDFQNVSDVPATFFVRVNVSCTKGTGLPLPD